MVVKVIDCKPHQSVVKQAICRNCGCTLEYTPRDVVSKKVCDYDGSYDMYKHIKCPECEYEVAVS